MDLNHLHLHVRDQERARRFYQRYFAMSVRVRHGDILFLRNRDGFDLALAPDAAPAPLPDWFHFGFRLDRPDQVRTLYRRMRDDGLALPEPLVDEPDLVSFRCADPDGHRVEIYWE